MRNKRQLAISQDRYQQGEEKDSNNKNDRENGLRMKNEMTMKEKSFSFFADSQEREAENLPKSSKLTIARNTTHTLIINWILNTNL